MSEQLDLPPGPMAIPEFFARADRQPKRTYEPVEGRPRVVAMAPPLLRHPRTKAAAFLALRKAVRAAGLPCQAFTDGVAIQVAPGTPRVPDASVNRGLIADNDTRTLPDPAIVVEVLSPSTERKDMVARFRDDARVPSIRHHLLPDPNLRLVMHHVREEDGTVRSALAGAGPLRLGPPGLMPQVEELFEA